MALWLETVDEKKFFIVLAIEMIVLIVLFGMATVWNSMRETPLTDIGIAIILITVASLFSQKTETIREENNQKSTSSEGWNSIKLFLKGIGWIFVILIVFLLGSVIIIGSGIFTTHT
jgi:uncharacterized membrane protein